MNDLETIKSLIPHRDPFLLVDKIIEHDQDKGQIITEKTFPLDLDVFKGHYPDNPIVPGVLLCEAIFQSGALLMALGASQTATDSESKRVPVLTRIGGAKFKRFAGPGDTVSITVTLKETISSVAFFIGKLRIHNKLAVQVEFSCAMVAKE